MDVFEAIDAGDVDAVRALVAEDPSRAAARDSRGLPAVLAALYRHRRDLVDVLLAAAPELDVFTAAAVGDVARLSELLSADPALVHACAPDGFFPLTLAAYFDAPQAVELLLERGADVSAVARNAMAVQPLHSAVAGRSGESVRLLLAAGADPNARQHGGWTPLMAAAAHGDTELVELLLRHGADPTTADDAGVDAASRAAEHGHHPLAEQLRSRGQPSGNRSTIS